MPDDTEGTPPLVEESPTLEAEYEQGLAEIASMHEADEAAEEAAAPVVAPVEEQKPETQNDKRVQLILRREAAAKKAADEARAEKLEAQRTLEAIRAERAALEALRKPAEEDVDPDELDALLARKLGKDAPEDLQLRARFAARARKQEAELREIKEQLRKRDEEQAQLAAQAQERDLELRARVHLRTNVLPKFSDELAAVRALANDEEFADGVLTQGIQRYRQLYAEQGEATPEEAFRPTHEALVRMVKRLVADPAFARAAGITAGPAPEATKTKPTIADEKQPAPPPKTLSNKQHVGTTRLRTPRTMDEEYQAALEEVVAMQRGD